MSPWLLPLMLIAALGLMGVSKRFLNDLLVGAAIISFVGILFVGSAFAVVRIDRSCEETLPE